MGLLEAAIIRGINGEWGFGRDGQDTGHWKELPNGTEVWVPKNHIPEYDCSGLITAAMRDRGCYRGPKLSTTDILDNDRLFETITDPTDIREGDIVVFDVGNERHSGIVMSYSREKRQGRMYSARPDRVGGIQSNFFGSNPDETYFQTFQVRRLTCASEPARPLSDADGWFKRAETIGRPKWLDPLVLDLDGDGIQTTNVKAGAYFDHDGNGFAEQTGWVASGDGLLVMDRNGNGIIDDGKELFGGNTILKNGTRAANGFQALADLDSNGDGKIDAQDGVFSQLRVWQDLNGDGYSQPNELYTLDQLGIKSINLASTITNTTDAQGNLQNRLGSFEKIDGTTGQIGQYNLQTGTTYTIPTQWLVVPEDIAALPDLRGYGVVYDLRQAIVRDTSGQLKSLVEQFVNTTDPNSLDALMEQILFKWTGSDGIDVESTYSLVA